MKNLPSAIALAAGPAFFLFTLLTDPMFDGMSEHAWLIMGMTGWMAIWWITEAVSIPATALLPIPIVPLLNLDKIGAVTASYANPVIFLFLGGFTISIAMERWNLHKRIALLTMMSVGSKPSQQLAGLMAVTAFLSMWISNTATAVLMLPIGLSIIAMQQNTSSHSENFAKAVLLAIAYSASIGGVSTIISTPPNVLLAGYMSDNYGLEIGFLDWMMVGVPLAVSMLLVCWIWLAKIHYKLDKMPAFESRSIYKEKLKELGRMQRGEIMVLCVFVSAALGWVFNSYIREKTGIQLTDAIVAMLAACALFILPTGAKSRVLTWDDCSKLPFGILILFGGGLALSAQIQASGLSNFIADQVSRLGTIEIAILVVLVATVINLLTEITSNTATAATFIPLLGPVAVSMDANAAMLVIPTALAASCAFMLPVSTPPNAIVFASGHLKINDMIRAGFVLSVASIFFISLATLYIVPRVFNF